MERQILLATVRMSVMVISCFFVHFGCRAQPHSLRTTVSSDPARGREAGRRRGGRQRGEEMRPVWEILKFIDVEQKGGRQKDTKGRAAVLTSGSSSSNRQLTRYSIPNTEDKNTGGPRSCIQESRVHLDSPDCWTRDNPTCPAMSYFRAGHYCATFCGRRDLVFVSRSNRWSSKADFSRDG